MSSDSTLEDAYAGLAKGTLNWSSDRIADLVRKFKNRDLSFIEDQETIDEVKAQKSSPEFNLYSKYVFDRDLRLLFQMGLVLRKIENNKVKVAALRQKIVKKYTAKGLRIAELVQSGVFARYVALLLPKSIAEKDIVNSLESVLEDIDKYTFFIASDKNSVEVVDILKSRLNVLVPKVIIVFSKGDEANTKLDEIIGTLKAQITGYSFEMQVDMDSKQKLCFILKTADLSI